MQLALISITDQADEEMAGFVLVRAMSSPAKFGRMLVEESLAALRLDRVHTAVIDPYLSAELVQGSGWGTHPRWAREYHDNGDRRRGIERSVQAPRGPVRVTIEHRADGGDGALNFRVEIPPPGWDQNSDATTWAEPVPLIVRAGEKVTVSLGRNFRPIPIRLCRGR